MGYKDQVKRSEHIPRYTLIHGATAIESSAIFLSVKKSAMYKSNSDSKLFELSSVMLPFMSAYSSVIGRAIPAMLPNISDELEKAGARPPIFDVERPDDGMITAPFEWKPFMDGDCRGWTRGDGFSTMIGGGPNGDGDGTDCDPGAGVGGLLLAALPFCG